MKLRILFSFCLLLISYCLTANDNNFVYTGDPGVMEVHSGMEIYEDVTAELPIDSIVHKKFTPISSIPSVRNATSATWVKFNLENASDYYHLMLELENIGLENVEVFTVDPVTDTLERHIQINESMSFNDRKYSFVYYVFDLFVPPGGNKDIYIKAETQWLVILPMNVGSESKITGAFSKFDFYMGIYFGIMFIMIFFGVYIFLSIGGRSYLWYALYLVSFALLQISLTGYGNKFLWPDSPWITNNILGELAISTSVLVIQFFRAFLKTKKMVPTWDKVLRGIMVAFGGLFIFSVLSSSSWVGIILNYMTFAMSAIILVIGVILAFKKDGDVREARLFILAWGFFIVSVSIYTLNNLGFLGFSSNAYYSIQFGSLFEILILTYALTTRINKLSREKEEMMAEQNVLLEKKVEERTTGLVEQNEVISRQNVEKEVMLKEIHHRVKNNLQVVISLLRLQSISLKDDSDQELFFEAQQRIRAMALVHEKLYGSTSLAKIKTDNYIKTLVDELVSNYQLSNSVKVHFNVDPMELGIKTMIPLGLLLNEMVTNSIKYAFVGREEGEIDITLKASGDKILLRVADNGIGIKNRNESEGIGMELIDAFVDQLDGEMTMPDSSGTTFVISFSPQTEEVIKDPTLSSRVVD